MSTVNVWIVLKLEKAATAASLHNIFFSHTLATTSGVRASGRLRVHHHRDRRQSLRSARGAVAPH
jgi:hypothetical protein